MRYAIPLLTRLVSVLLALLLIAAGIVALVEIVSAWVGAGWTVLPDNTGHELRTLHWDDGWVIAALVTAGVVGLVALALGLWPRPPLTLPVAGYPEAGVERHSIEQSVRRQLLGIDGITGAHVKATSKRLVARASTTRQTGHDELRATAQDCVAAFVVAQGLPLVPDVRVRRPGRS